MKGLIALDIDGTLTTDMRPTPQAVVDYLHQLVEKGWAIVFITGRTFHWGYEALRNLDFTYYYAVQNGAAILEMPARRLISRKYLEAEILPEVEALCLEEQVGLVVYCGYERSGYCYYRPADFSAETLEYLERRMIAFHEVWEKIDSYDQIPMQDFPVVKCFGKEEEIFRVGERVEKELLLDAPVIRDPFQQDYFLMQATRRGINKGQALIDIRDKLPAGKVIAAGDDNNDIAMLRIADIKIAMSNAPEAVRRMADIVAPSAGEEGIIEGLTRALRMVG